MHQALAHSRWFDLSGVERAAAVGRATGTRLAQEYASVIQRDCLSRGWRAGEVIGTLPGIRRRYGLGRWACREAVAILEMRGWLESRRGAGGGLVLTVPDGHDLARLMLSHLCLKGLPVDQLIEARQLVHRMVVESLLMRGTTEAGSSSADSEKGAGCTDFSQRMAARTGNGALAFLMEVVTAMYARCTPVMPATSASTRAALEAAVVSGNSADAHAMLANFLEQTEALRAGRAVALPALFRRDGSRATGTHAEGLAQQLMQTLVQRGPEHGRDLGTEAWIGERYRVNRDVVRQAIRVLEDIGAVVARRGRRGGLERREPVLSTVVELIPPLILQRGVTATEVNDAAAALQKEALRYPGNEIVAAFSRGLFLCGPAA